MVMRSGEDQVRKLDHHLDLFSLDSVSSNPPVELSAFVQNQKPHIIEFRNGKKCQVRKTPKKRNDTIMYYLFSFRGASQDRLPRCTLWSSLTARPKIT